MKQWLVWREGEFGPVLTGRANRLYEGETPEAFLEALAGADPEALVEYNVPLYEVLIHMAEENDAPSVRRLPELVPGLDLRGYREGFTALGAAAVKGAVHAMEALWDAGAGTDLGIGLPCDELEFCWQYDVPPEAVERIFRRGAPVDPCEVWELIRNEEWALLRLVLQAAKPERIACGNGVAGLIGYVKDCIREDPEAAEGSEQGLELLKEFI